MIETERPKSMFIHIFLFHWKTPVSTEIIAKTTAELNAFIGQVSGLVEMRVGENLSPNAGHYPYGGYMKFTDEAAFTAYCTHPLHLALLDWLLPLIDPIELDL
ncbi:MAG: hypothetical protein RLY97_1232 [Pseudomonadota bacterium]|jgi:hypothetical protein